jgi:hypothetical protein
MQGVRAKLRLRKAFIIGGGRVCARGERKLKREEHFPNTDTKNLNNFFNIAPSIFLSTTEGRFIKTFFIGLHIGL